MSSSSIPDLLAVLAEAAERTRTHFRAAAVAGTQAALAVAREDVPDMRDAALLGVLEAVAEACQYQLRATAWALDVPLSTLRRWLARPAMADLASRMNHTPGRIPSAVVG